MFETHNTAIVLRPSIEAMNEAVTTLWQRYEPAFVGEELEQLHSQAEERVADVTRKLWRDLPEDDHDVTYSAIMAAYDDEYDF